QALCDGRSRQAQGTRATARGRRPLQRRPRPADGPLPQLIPRLITQPVSRPGAPTPNAMFDPSLAPPLPGGASAPLRVLSLALEQRDAYTEGHCNRVCRLAFLLGQRFDLDAVRLGHLALAARFHDAGKIGVRDEVLLHPASSTRPHARTCACMRSSANACSWPPDARMPRMSPASSATTTRPSTAAAIRMAWPAKRSRWKCASSAWPTATTP